MGQLKVSRLTESQSVGRLVGQLKVSWLVSWSTESQLVGWLVNWKSVGGLKVSQQQAESQPVN